jgi:hypothetical protein
MNDIVEITDKDLINLIAKRFNLPETSKISKALLDKEFNGITIDILHYYKNGNLKSTQYYVDAGFIEDYQ